MASGSWIRIGAVNARLDAKTINAIIKKELGDRAVSITQKPALRQAIGQEFIRAVTPFVPYKTGRLSSSGRATPDGRVYWTAIGKNGENYAAEMYDALGLRWPNGYLHPTRGKSPDPNHDPQPRWVEAFLADTSKYDAFKNNIIPIIVEGFNKDG